MVAAAMIAIVVAAPTATAATRSCPDNYSSFPGISAIRAENMSCAKVRVIIRSIRRYWRRHDEPPSTVDVRGETFRCVYRYRQRAGSSYYRAGCRSTRRTTRRVSMSLTS